VGEAAIGAGCLRDAGAPIGVILKSRNVVKTDQECPKGLVMLASSTARRRITAPELTCRFPHVICAKESVSSICIACYARAATGPNKTDLAADDSNLFNTVSRLYASQAKPLLVNYLLFFLAKDVVRGGRFLSFPSARPE
jgi:hypothetical protein